MNLTDAGNGLATIALVIVIAGTTPEVEWAPWVGTGVLFVALGLWAAGRRRAANGGDPA